jgi:two-component system chemotaxis sensor kinase CheA
MPIVPISSEMDMSQPAYPVLVVAADGRAIGLVADEIVDIIEEKLEIQLASSNSALVGSAEIRGEAVELIDVSHFIRLAEAEKRIMTPQRVLFAADDQLVRDMLCPALSAAGFSLVASAIPSDTGEFLAQMASYDAVILDADAPSLASPAMLRALKDRKDAARTPAIGISRNPTPRATRIATDNGMVALLSKHDRDTLIETLAYALDAAADAKAASMELAA